MRRRPGLVGLKTDATAKGQYRALGDNAARERTEQMKEQLETFRRSLEEFAQKHKSDIRRHPEFRAQFHAMCAQCGVDPLASRKGFWAELLGIGDFYFELGVQIADICLAARWASVSAAAAAATAAASPVALGGGGGLIDVADLRIALQSRRSGGGPSKPEPQAGVGEGVTEDDIVRAVGKLKALGGGFGIVTIGSRRYVKSVPSELSTDHADVLRLAQGTSRGLTKEEVAAQLQWSPGRASDALASMLRDGVAMVDDGHADGRRRFWFPCVTQGLGLLADRPGP